MAELPPRRLPASLMRKVDEPGLDLDEGKAEGSNMEVESGEERSETGDDFNSVEESHASESSENDEDGQDSSNDSEAASEEIDYDLEYQKEMEEERIADQKNGHSVGDLESETSMLRTRRKEYTRPAAGWPMEAAAAHVARHIARGSFTSAMNLDAIVGGGGSSSNVEGVTPEIYGGYNLNNNSNLCGERGIDFNGLERAENNGQIVVYRGGHGVNTHRNNSQDLDDMEIGDNSGNETNYGSVSLNSQTPDMEENLVRRTNLDAHKSDTHLMSPKHAVSDLITENNGSVLNGKEDFSVMGSGEHLGAAVIAHPTCMNFEVKHGNLREYLSAVPRGQGPLMRPLHALEGARFRCNLVRMQPALTF